MGEGFASSVNNVVRFFENAAILIAYMSVPLAICALGGVSGVMVYKRVRK
jgi:hypothetical protein